MKSALSAAILLAVVWVAGCGGEPPAPALKFDEASRIVVENLNAVWPESVSTGEVGRGSGCYTNPKTLMPEGPPWIPGTSATVINPTQEFIDKTLSNLEAMTARGFVLKPAARIPGEEVDSVRRFYEDDRGFSLSVGREPSISPAGVRFSLTSAGPCVDE